MENHEQKILKREERLLKNEKSWRRSRVLAIFIFFFHLFGLFVLITMVFIEPENSLSRTSRTEGLAAMTFFACLFWLLVIEWTNRRIWHIDSIKLYRKKLNQQQPE